MLGIAAPAAADSHPQVTNGEDLQAVIDAAEAVVEIEIVAPGFEISTPIMISDKTVRIFSTQPTAEDAILTVNGDSPAFIITGIAAVILERIGITGGNDRRASGGGVSVGPDATLILQEVSMWNNFAGEGGAVYNEGHAEIYDSVFYDNSTSGKGGAVNNAGTLYVENSTFASNDAQQGGALSSAGDAVLNFVTIVGNSSKNKIGAGTHLNGGTISLSNSIVANNYSGGSFYDCSGQTDVNRVLFSSVQGCQPSGIDGVDYKVVAQVDFPTNGNGREYPFDNGGPTKTVALVDQIAGGAFDHPAADFGLECLATDQRGVARPQPDGCDVGAYEVNLGLDVALETTVDGFDVDFVEVGAVTVPLDNLPLASAAAKDGGTTASAQLSAIELAAAQLSAIQLSAIQLSAIQLSAIDPASAQLSAIQLSAIQLSAIQLSAILLEALQLSAIQLSAISLADIQLSAISPYAESGVESVAELLCDPVNEPGETDAYCNVPLQALTLDQLLESEPGITLVDIDFSATQLSAIQLSAIVLVQLPLESLQLSAIDNQQAWCDALGLDESTTPTCADLDMSTNLLELSESYDSATFDSTQLSAIQLSAIQLSAIGEAWATLEPAQLSAIQLSAIQLSAINWASTQLSAIQPSATQLSAICDPSLCAAGDSLGDIALADAFLDAATVYDLLLLFAEEPLASSDYTLVDLLFGLIPPTTSAWEDLGDDLNLVPLADAADNTGTPRQGSGIKQPTFDYSVTIGVEGGSPSVDVALTLPRIDGVPAGFSFASPDGTVPDPAEPPGVPYVRLDGVDRPDITPVAFDSASTCLTSGDVVFLGIELSEGAHTLEVPMWAGTTLGTFTGEASVCASGGQSAEAGPASASIEVVEEADASVTIDFDDLEVAHINDEGEVRQYQFVLGQRSQARIRLESRVDLDLVLFGPPLPNYLRGEPQLTFGLQEDFVYGLIPGDQSLDPNTINDIPLTPPDSGSVVHAVSATLGGVETIDTGALRPGTYTIQVSGYNGTIDNRAFALRLKTWPLPDVACPAAPNLWPDGVTAPSTPTGINTVFLYNAAAYAAAGGIQSDLVDLIEDSRWAVQGIAPAAVAVDAYPGVRGALRDWAAHYCNPAAANDVVRQIGVEILDPIVAQNPDLEYIVIVGDDDHVPYARNTDGTFVSNETSHGVGLGPANAIKAALAEGYYLTDTPYAGRSYSIADREFFIPVQAYGRLAFSDSLEGIAQLETRFNEFLDSGGVLSGNGDAVVGGYDFLLDAAQAATDALDPAFGLVTSGADGTDLQSLLGEKWNKNHFLDALASSASSGTRASVAVIEAHFDESNFAPANADPGGSVLPPTDALLSVQDYLAGVSQAAFILSPGCHAALDTNGLDWPDITDILGNTGYGYGDTEIVALSEKLVEETAARIGGQTLAAAARDALNEYARDLYVVTPYDLKVMEQFAIFGFPMARAALAPDGDSSPAASDTIPMPQPTFFNDAYTGLPSASSVLDFGDLAPMTAPLSAIEDWTTAGYDLLTVRGHAVLPEVTVDVTSTGRIAAGVLVTGLSSSPKDPFDPVIFDPQAGEVYSPGVTTPDLRLRAGDITFPSTVQSSVRRHLGVNGTEQDTVVIVPARHYTEGGESTFEVFTDVELQTFYRPDGWSDADQPAIPFIERAIGRSKDGVVEFDITVQPPSNGTTERVLVLYRPDSNLGGPWFPLELASPDGTRWIGRAEPGLLGTYEFKAQAVSNLGDVAIATGKGIHYDTLDDELQQGLRVFVSDARDPVLDYWYPARTGDTGEVVDVVATAVAAEGTSLCRFELARDDTGALITTGDLSGSVATFDIEGDGEYLLTVFGGSDCLNPTDVGVLAVAVDGTPPNAEITVTTEPDATKEVTLVAFDLSPDGTAGSGVQRIEYCLTEVCGEEDWIVYDGPFPITETTIVKYRAIDYLGYESDIGSETVVVDVTAPALSDSATSNGSSYVSGDWTNGDVSVTFRADDDESGVASLTVNDVAVASDPDGAPFLEYTKLIADEGVTVVTYSAVDVVGNEAAEAQFVARIDRTDPTVVVSAVAASGLGEIPYSSGTWTNADAVSVTLTAADDVEVADFSVTVEGVEVTSPVLVTAEGQTTISYSASDLAGNSVSGSFDVWIDRTPPDATVTLPSYHPDGGLGSFTCDASGDGLSALASCEVDIDGTVVGSGDFNPDGSFSGTFDIDPTPVGAIRIVTVTATDEAGNVTEVSESYGTAYGYCLLYDPTKATSGTVSVKLRITTNTYGTVCDGTEDNISSNNIKVYAYQVDGVDAIPQDSGSSNSSPTRQFRYDPKKQTDGYIYNLQEVLNDGDHLLTFTVNEDPVEVEPTALYEAPFTYKN